MTWKPDSRLTELLESAAMRSLGDFRDELSRATAALAPDHARRGIRNTGIASTHTWKSTWQPRLESLPERLEKIARDLVRDYGHEIDSEVAAWLAEELKRPLQQLEDGLEKESASLFPRDRFFAQWLRDLLRGEGRLDPALHILHKAAFNDDRAEACERAARTGTPVALFVLDLDRFKMLNDGHGHLAGDEALKAVAGRLTQIASRFDGKAYRIGGDEFAVIARVQGAADHQTLAEEIRAAVETPPLTPHPDVHVGVSIGFAIAPADGHEPDKWHEIADQRLRHDKDVRKAAR